MRRRAISIVLAAIASCLGSVDAYAQQWVYSPGKPSTQAYITFPAIKTALVLLCRPDLPIALGIEGQLREAGFQINLPLKLRIGREEFAANAFGYDTGVHMSDTSKLSMSPRMVAALKRGDTLVLDGPAATRMRTAMRTYPIGGIASVLSRMERDCRLPVSN